MYKRIFTKIFVLLFLITLSTYYAGFINIAVGDTDNALPNLSCDKPMRIVVFPLFAEEILLEMVGPERIVYVGHRYLEDGTSYSPTMEMTKSIPGSNWQNCDGETIVTLEPDLVILWDDLEGSYEQGILFPELREAQIPVQFLPNPQNIQEIKDAISYIGRIVGESEKAAQMIRRMDAEMRTISTIIEKIPNSEPMRVVYYNSWQDGFSEVARICAAYSPYTGENGCAVIDDTFLAEWNPDVIFFNPASIDTDGSLLEIHDQYIEATTFALLNHPKLTDTTAIKSKKVYALNLHTSQFIIQTIWDAMYFIYPEMLAEDW